MSCRTKHRGIHWSHSSRHRRNRLAFFPHIFEIDIPNELVSDPVDADVDYDCSIPNMLFFDQVGLPYSGDQNISSFGMFEKIASPLMT